MMHLQRRIQIIILENYFLIVRVCMFKQYPKNPPVEAESQKIFYI